MATFAGALAPDGPALLIDAGTTTTDLIPLRDGTPMPTGRTDCERLRSGELIYSGVARTPLCALVDRVPFRGESCPLAAELFATTLDVYLTLVDIPENPNDTQTANGKPATKAAAHDRLARCLCCDATEFSAADAMEMAKFVAGAQRRQIARGIDAVAGRQGELPRRLVISGSGSFLAERTLSEHARLAGAPIVRFADRFGPAVSEAACAFALARLALDQLAVQSAEAAAS